MFVRMTPQGIFNDTFGQIPAVFMATKTFFNEQSEYLWWKKTFWCEVMKSPAGFVLEQNRYLKPKHDFFSWPLPIGFGA